VAEREGFEPPVVLPTTVFKTAALNRSAISPGTKVYLFCLHPEIFLKFIRLQISTGDNEAINFLKNL
jgi:hypothetical protein